MKPLQPLTPAMLGTRYHGKRSDPLPPADPARRPPLGPNDDEDATAGWLAHIAAGRIEVR